MVTEATTTPRLTLILCSRNDSYMGNSVWRLQTTLNYVAQCISDLDKESEVEILLTDWGSKTALAEALDLNEPARRLVRFLIVPLDVAIPLQKDSPFPEVIALNAAVRRARGEFIGRIDQDTIVGKRFFKLFFDVLDGKRQLDDPLHTLPLFANRRRIPYRLAVKCPPALAIEKAIDWFGKFFTIEISNPFVPFYITFVGIWLLHRDLWFECGAFDETMTYMNGMEFDMATRLLTKYKKVVDLGKLVDYDFYHLEHYHPLKRRNAKVHRKTNLTRWAFQDVCEYKASVFAVNEPDWGLNNHALEITSYEPGSTRRASTPFTLDLVKTSIVYAVSFFQMSLDALILAPRTLYKLAEVHSTQSAHRVGVAYNALKGRRVTDWPTLIRKAWRERKSAQVSWLDRHRRLQSFLRPGKADSSRVEPIEQ